MAYLAYQSSEWDSEGESNRNAKCKYVKPYVYIREYIKKIEYTIFSTCQGILILNTEILGSITFFASVLEIVLIEFKKRYRLESFIVSVAF